jgi:phospholipid transport system substrate-binding protein
MKIRLFIILAMLVCFTFPLSAVAKPSVTEEVKKTVDEVVRIVADKELKKASAKKERRATLRNTIGSLFDYEEMTKRAMGANWKKLTAAQKSELTGLFTTLLENSYASKIESYNNEKVVYVREIQDTDYAEVKTKIITTKHDEYAVDYRLMPEKGKWHVYDVVIEGVSLVSNYRSQFGQIMNDKGYDELVSKLRAKNQEIKSH